MAPTTRFHGSAYEASVALALGVCGSNYGESMALATGSGGCDSERHGSGYEWGVKKIERDVGYGCSWL
jgi:hypothetical protein